MKIMFRFFSFCYKKRNYVHSFSQNNFVNSRNFEASFCRNQNFQFWSIFCKMKRSKTLRHFCFKGSEKGKSLIYYLSFSILHNLCIIIFQKINFLLNVNKIEFLKRNSTFFFFPGYERKTQPWHYQLNFCTGPPACLALSWRRLVDIFGIAVGGEGRASQYKRMVVPMVVPAHVAREF